MTKARVERLAVVIMIVVEAVAVAAFLLMLLPYR
jgi:hypothetical protein